MVSPALKFLLHVVGGIFGLVALMSVAVVWRLSSGPVSLAWVSPQIERAVNAEFTDYRLQFDDVILSANHSGSWPPKLDVRGIGIHARQFDSGVSVLVPEISMELDVGSMLQGAVVLTGLTFHEPRLDLVLDPAGGIRFDHSEDEPETEAPTLVETFLTGLVEAPDTSTAFGSLKRVAFNKARLAIQDPVRDMVWSVPRADIEISRAATGFDLRGSLSVALADGPVALSVSGGYHPNMPDKPAFRSHVAFASLKPARLAPFVGEVFDLGAIDLPLTGTLAAGFDRAGALVDVAFDVSATPGTADLGFVFPDTPSRKIEQFYAKGLYETDGNVIAIDALSVDFGSVSARAEGRLAGDWEQPDTKMSVTLTNVQSQEIPLYWPPTVARNAREWVLSRVSAGTMERFTATLDLRATDWTRDRLPGKTISGGYRLVGGQVTPIEGLPPVQEFAADATFDGDKMTIVFDAGTLGTMTLHDGQAVLRDLGLPEEHVMITVSGTGTVEDTLDILSMPPLEYTQSLGMDPNAFAGRLDLGLSMRIPLSGPATIDGIDIQAVADLTEVAVSDQAFPEFLAGYEARDCSGTVFIDRDGLDLTAHGLFGDASAEIVWRENFGAFSEVSDVGTAEEPFARRLDIRLAVSETMRRNLGIHDPRVLGPMDAAIHLIGYGDNRWNTEARLDLMDTRLDLPMLAWSKDFGIPGRAEVALGLEAGAVNGVDQFWVSAPGLEARGGVNLGPKDHEIRFDYLLAGATEGAMTLTVADDGHYVIDMSGKRLDLRPLLAHEDEDGEGLEVPVISLTGVIAEVIVDDAVTLRNVQAQAEHNGEILESASVTGIIGEDQQIQFQLEPAGNARRLVLVSDNAGAVAHALGITEKMVGGALTIEGLIDDSSAAHPVSGEISVTNFHIVEAPFMAKFLSAASVTGGLEMLQGDGLPFDQLIAPFEWQDGRLVLDRARANGVSLGLTASGIVDMDQDSIDLDGVIVPAYVINSIFSNIPVIGEILTGGEGEGMFAAAYGLDGALSEPRISVNPFSALTPGILRDIFKVFDDFDEKEVGAVDELPSRATR